MTSSGLSPARRRRFTNRAAAVAAALLALAGLVTVSGTAAAAERPQVTSISPAAGPQAGGNTLKITGTNLVGTDPKATRIAFWTDAYATDVVCTATTCTGTVPPGQYATSYPESVETDGGDSLGHGPDVYYTYHRLPVVTGISPTSGTAAGGTQVTITGTSLAGTTSIAFGPGRNATNVSCTSSTTCTATTPLRH
ncbi:IPT/TIG domain-containing protein [Streptomyces spororaveus]|uniref:IPT/TIG domain-containing protein n=1 Tax=Streptomyces spororaveus TaxID=284039 RepID=UPI0037AE1FD0